MTGPWEKFSGDVPSGGPWAKFSQPQGDVAPKGVSAGQQRAESNGVDFNKDGTFLTSPKGAMGRNQVLLSTARKPGLPGVSPLNEDIWAKGTPQQKADELARVGDEYMDALRVKYKGDEKLALAAYNAGFGAVDKAGGVPNFKETKDYIAKIKPTMRFGPWDTGVKIPEPLDAGLARAGGATLDAVGAARARLGFGEPQQVVDDRKATNELIEENNPKSALIGNIGANVGMMYAGGGLLKGAGVLSKAIPYAEKGLTVAGQALSNPSTIWESMAGGAGYNAATSYDNAMGAAAEGAAGGGLGYGVGKVAGAAGSAVINKVKQGWEKVRPINIGQLDDLIINKFGLPKEQFMSLAASGQNALRQMANDALSSGKELTPEMVQRVADFQASGIEKPLKGWVSRDPMEWNKAHELQGVDDEITRRWSNANNSLVSKVKGVAPDASDYALGTKLSNEIKGKDAALKSEVDKAYKAYRDMGGREVPLDAQRFNNEVGIELYEKMAGGKLPKDIISWFDKIASGKEPFTFSTGAQRLEAINGLISNTNDKSEKYALQIVKRKLEDAISGWGENAYSAAIPQGLDSGLDKLAEAFKGARTLASERFKFHQSSPLHEAIIDGKFTAEKLPDLIKGIGVDQLKVMQATDAKYGTNSISSLRDAAGAFIRDSAMIQAETGGKFTQAGLRRAMDKIGPENGAILFGDQWLELQAMLRAGGAMMNQPAGVIPANSGTGQMLARMLQSVPGVSPILTIGTKAAHFVKQAADARGQLGGMQFTPDGAGRAALQDVRSGPAGVFSTLGYYGGVSGQHQ